MIEKREIHWKVLIVCLILVFIAAWIGNHFTSASVNSSWYQQIKPNITPPNWVFPIVWTILFLLLAISLYLAFIGANSLDKISITAAFGLNLFFNVAWSAFYFGMKNTGMAFFDLIFLWLSIILIMKITWRIDRKASYLLIPYPIWVSFAGILNYLSV
jgi:translocator protein